MNGDIRTNAGAVNLGAGNTVGDSISTQAGVVTIGANAIIGGAGNGNISTTGGDVTVGDSSRMCGSVTTVAGVVVMEANIKIGANVVTSGGGITVTGTITTGMTTIGGYLDAKAAGAVVLTQVLIGGHINVAVGALTLTGTRVRGDATHPAAYTPTDSKINDATVSFTPACEATNVTPTTAPAASFDALETGTNLPWNKAARKPLYTKLIGTPFTLDIAALTTDGTLESAYVTIGAVAKYVKLELFDDVGAACSAYTSPVASQTASFTSTLFSGAPGRMLSGTFTVPDVHKSLLVRIRECADNTCTGFTSTTPACSSDRFSVRPPVLTLSTKTSMGVPPEPTADQTVRAGTNFTLLAATSPVGGYRGVLTLDASKLTAQLPSEGTNSQNGGIIGLLTPSTLTANANAVIATYNEVGYLYIGIGAYRDDSFTAVDSGVGDCITSTSNNANLADTLVEGKYGCSIGNTIISSLGRFVPHHFKTEIVDRTPLICPADLSPEGQPCSAAYSGQPFTVTVTALNANGTPTLNYKNLLARNVTLEAWSAPGMLAPENQNPLTMIPVSAVAGHGILSSAPLGAFTDGVASANLTYTFLARYPATPLAALAAPTVIYLRARENSGVAADNATSAKTVAAASIEAGITVISGRFKVDNNYGSELLAVPILTRTQYWNGTRFVDSTTDGLTSISASDVTRSNCQKKLIAGSDCMPLIVITPASPVMTRGALRLKLASPGTGKTGSVDVSINSSTSPWLPSTKARISFGIYKAGPVIYLREMY